MFRLIAIILSLICIRCTQEKYTKNEMVTIFPRNGENLVLIREMEASSFKNSHLVRIQNGNILNEIDLGDNEFYMFDKEVADTVYIISAVLSSQGKISSFLPEIRHYKLGNRNIKISSRPFYGSG